jgi:hypothetical protein
MTYKEYLALVAQTLPHLKDIEQIPYLSKLEAIKIVAIELYLTPLDQMCNGLTAMIDLETKKQFHSLREHGVHCFE